MSAKKQTTGENKTVLLVEDDAFIARAYGIGLSKAGLQVQTAGDGQEGLERMRELKPAVVLLDLIMPVKDGFDVLEEMRADAKLKNIPVIILSNLGQESDIERVKKFGVKHYLVKADYSMQEVVETVQKALVGKE